LIQKSEKNEKYSTKIPFPLSRSLRQLLPGKRKYGIKNNHIQQVFLK